MARSLSIPLAALLAAAAVALGCASGPGSIRAPSAEGSMVYGSLELPKEVAGQIQWVILYRLGDVYVMPFKSPIKARVFPNGDFYSENVKPGSYYVHDLAAGYEAFYLYPPKMGGAKEAVLPHVVEVKPASLTYLGRYRIHHWERGVQSRMSPTIGSVRLLSSTPEGGPNLPPNFLNSHSALVPGAGVFSLEWTRRPADERRVLGQILREVAGTGWDSKVETRLSALH